jgi:transposase-like protein
VAESDPFKWRHYQGKIILLCVRWYLRYALSYRDLEEMIQERGLSLDHTTFYRWVQAYAPELEKRIRPHLRLTNDSYRVDETHVKIKGKWSSDQRQLKFFSHCLSIFVTDRMVVAS